MSSEKMLSYIMLYYKGLLNFFNDKQIGDNVLEFYKKVKSNFPSITDYDLLKGKLETSSLFDDEQRELAREKISSNKSNTVEKKTFGVILEMNRQYDFGFSKVKDKDEKTKEQNININKKIIDVHHLLYVLAFKHYRIPFFKKEVVFFKKAKKEKSKIEKEKYIYDYQDHKYKLKYIINDKPNSKDEPKNISTQLIEYLNYEFNINFIEENRTIPNIPFNFVLSDNISNLKINKPEEVKDFNIKRVKNIYSFPNLFKYWDLKLIFLEEYKKINRGQWSTKPRRKAFIEYHFKFNEFIYENSDYQETTTKRTSSIRPIVKTRTSIPNNDYNYKIEKEFFDITKHTLKILF